MKNTIHRLLLVLFFLFSLAFISCGNDDSTGDGSTSKDDTPLSDKDEDEKPQHSDKDSAQDKDQSSGDDHRNLKDEDENSPDIDFETDQDGSDSLPIDEDEHDGSDEDLCEEITCGENAECTLENGSAVCKCSEGFTHNDDKSDCINSKSVECLDAAPEYAHSTAKDVTITYSEDGGWSVPENCEWECDEGATLKDGKCKVDIDFAPASINRDNMVTDSQTLDVSGDVTVEVMNTSNFDSAKTYSVTLFEDINSSKIFDGGDSILGSADILPPHKKGTTVSVVVPIAGKLSFRDNTIYAFVDSNKVVDETDEDNNTMSSMGSCTMAPAYGAFNPVLEWEWTGSDMNSAWNQVMSTPIVINLTDDNGDGNIDDKDIPEIVFTTFKGNGYRNAGVLRAISGDGDGEIFAVGIDENYNLISSGTPAAGDVDGDGIPEIFLTTHNKTLMAFNNDGSFKWESETITGFSAYFGGPSIADIDHDGKSEIIVGQNVLNHDGTIRWVGSGGNGRGDSCIVDLDLDGDPEIIAGNTAYRADGSIYWTNSDAKNGFCAVADFNNDSYPEVVSVHGGYVTLIDYDGATIYGPMDIPPAGTHRDQGGAPVIADFDSDGLPEIGIAGGYNYVVIDTDFTIKWTKDTKDLSSNITGSSVFDFNGDEVAEVVYADETYLRVYNGEDGATLLEIPIGSGTLGEYPLIVDVDNDNAAEIVIASNNYAWGPKTGIQVFGDLNDGWVNTRKIWNQYSYHVTNINDDGSVPKHELHHCEPMGNYKLNSYRQNRAVNALGCKDVTASAVKITEIALGDIEIEAKTVYTWKTCSNC